MSVDSHHHPLLTGSSEGALAPYLRAIRAHWLLVALVTLASLGAAVAWISLRSPDYLATAQVLVSPLPADDATLEGVDVLRSDPTESTRTVQTAASLLDSPAAAQLTARSMGAGWSRSRVENAVDVQAQGQSNVISVSATAGDATTAARLANEFAGSALAARSATVRAQARVLLARLRPVQAAGSRTGQAAADLAQRIDRLASVQASGDPAFSLTQKAVAPTAPDQTSAALIVVLALLAGFTVGAAAALLTELMQRTVRDEVELRRIYPLPVLSHIPSLGRRGRRAMRSPTTTPPAVREAFRTLQVQLDRMGGHPRVLMLTSASTGDTKTTSAVNLAITLVAAGHRVILFDFDLRKPDVARALGVERRARVASLFSEGARIEDLLSSAADAPTLRVLATDGENDVVMLDALGRQLPSLIDQARALADYVIIDTPPLGEISDALRLVDLVDDIVLVARPGNTERVNLETMRDLLQRTGKVPMGFLIVGSDGARQSSYYAYGMTQSDMGRRERAPSRAAGK